MCNTAALPIPVRCAMHTQVAVYTFECNNQLGDLLWSPYMGLLHLGSVQNCVYGMLANYFHCQHTAGGSQRHMLQQSVMHADSCSLDNVYIAKCTRSWVAAQKADDLLRVDMRLCDALHKAVMVNAVTTVT